MSYRLEASFAFHRTADEDPTMNEFLDQVDVHLVESLGAREVAIVSDGEESTFTVALLAQGDDLAVAFPAALAMLRTAFHAQDGETPDWPQWTELLAAGVVPKKVVEKESLAA